MNSVHVDQLPSRHQILGAHKKAVRKNAQNRMFALQQVLKSVKRKGKFVPVLN
jgi:hypothetical protein